MKTILYIEGSEFFQRIISDLVSEEGYNIIFAISGAEALKILKNETIDMIFTAYVLEDMDAVLLMDQIKLQNLDYIPIVLISSYDEVKDIKDLFKMGINDYVLKKDIQKKGILEDLFKSDIRV